MQDWLHRHVLASVTLVQDAIVTFYLCVVEVKMKAELKMKHGWSFENTKPIHLH